MKILLNGSEGKMGKEFRKISKEEGFILVGLSDKKRKDLPSVTLFNEKCDVLVDFSDRKATREICDYAVKNLVPAVIATTGQTKADMQMIRDASKKVPIFLSSNMSSGIYFLSETVKKAALLFPDYDIEIVEKHNRNKTDCPSGTAKYIAEKIAEVRNNSYRSFGREGFSKREKDEIGIFSVRIGSIIGEHEIMIGSEDEILTFSHHTLSRRLFAKGAFAAAKFIIGKPCGLYGTDDLSGGKYEI